MATPTKSYRAAYSQHILRQHLLKLSGKTELPKRELVPRDENGKPKSRPEADPPYDGRICIVGAGACGLYLAMMLKYLGFSNVDILEASDRVGGRCYTYPQPGDITTHSYYDVGAMRIPDIEWMQQLVPIDLCRYLKELVAKHGLTYHSILHFIRNTLGLGAKVVPYIYENVRRPPPPVCYTYKHKAISDKKFDKTMAPLVDPFIAETPIAFDAAFNHWLHPDCPPHKHEPLKDDFSTRGWLMHQAKPRWSYDDTATAEIYDTSSGLFDQSLTETVIDYADFHAAKKKPWWRIDGGMQTVTDTMESMLHSSTWPPKNLTAQAPKLVRNTPVTAMSLSADKTTVNVTSAGNPIPYDMVFNTTAMAPLQQMNLEGLGLPPEVLTGIRTLSYDRATKVVIKFKSPWWWENPDKTQIYGGISATDLPISNVVYPSWNDGEDTSAVLMVSYSWAQDASRMASLVQDYTVVKRTKDDPILTLCLQNLATLWEKTTLKPSFDWLKSQVVDDGSPCAPYHAWAWSHDPWTGGAFALFGPGQYENVYPHFLRLFANEHLAICGEALSAHHAWISGAFASAYLVMMLFLKSRNMDYAIKSLFYSPFGGGLELHPEELDETLLMHALELRREKAGKGDL